MYIRFILFQNSTLEAGNDEAVAITAAIPIDVYGVKKRKTGLCQDTEQPHTVLQLLAFWRFSVQMRRGGRFIFLSLGSPVLPNKW